MKLPPSEAASMRLSIFQSLMSPSSAIRSQQNFNYQALGYGGSSSVGPQTTLKQLLADVDAVFEALTKDESPKRKR